MMHVIVRLAAGQPALLATHLEAYGGLVAQALTASGEALKRRMTLQLLCALCLSVAAVLTGVAAMLWAVLPLGASRAPGMLVLAPSLPAALGLWAWWSSRAALPVQGFASLRAQLAADAALLSRPSAP